MALLSDRITHHASCIMPGLCTFVQKFRRRGTSTGGSSGGRTRGRACDETLPRRFQNSGQVTKKERRLLEYFFPTPMLSRKPLSLSCWSAPNTRARAGDMLPVRDSWCVVALFTKHTHAWLSAVQTNHDGLKISSFEKCFRLNHQRGRMYVGVVFVEK